MQRFLLLLILLILPGLSLAVPPVWETDFGDELTALTGEDDETTSVTLSFPFPFMGSNYTTIFVGTNGDLQLGSLGDDNDIDYDHWSYLEEFYSDLAPSLAVLNNDWDLGDNGTIHFNDFGNRAVFTWNEIGNNENLAALASFQVQIFADGRIIFGYNGILDGVDEDLIDDVGHGFVVGITEGEQTYGTAPATVDLSVFGSYPTAELSERWCYTVADTCGFEGDRGNTKLGQTTAKDKQGQQRSTGAKPKGFIPFVSGPINTAFDLDQTNVTFTPNGAGFIVNAGLGIQRPTVVPANTAWGLLLLGAAMLLLAFRQRHRWQR